MGTVGGLLAAHILRMSLAWWCLETTGSTQLFASMVALALAAEIYLKPFFAPFSDHFPRMAMIDKAQIGLVIVCFALVALLSFNQLSVPLLMLLVTAMSALVALRDPIVISAVPGFVSADKLSQALSQVTTFNASCMLLGPIFAAGLLSVLSINITVAVAFVTLILSTISYRLSAHHYAEQTPDSNNVIAKPHRSFRWRQQARQTFQSIFRVKSEFYLALIVAAVNFTLFPLVSVMVPYIINQQMQAPVYYLGIFEGVLGLGMIASSFYLVALLNRLMGRLAAVTLGFFILGISPLMMLSASSHAIILIFAFLYGASFIVINLNLSILRNNASPANYRSRMNAMVMFISNIATPPGLIFAGNAMSHFGVFNLVMSSSVIVLTLLSLILLSSNIRRALSVQDHDIRGFYLRTYPKAFE